MDLGIRTFILDLPRSRAEKAALRARRPDDFGTFADLVALL